MRGVACARKFQSSNPIKEKLRHIQQRLDGCSVTEVRITGGPAMGNAEKSADTSHDREFEKDFQENLGRKDRIPVYRRVDFEEGRGEETYILYRPPAEPEPIFMSGDCAAVRQAIDSGLLEPTGEATYRKREP